MNNCHFTAQSFVILGKVEYTKFRMGLQAAKCVLTNSYEMEYFQKSMMNQIYEASFLLFVFVDPSLIFRNPNPSLFSVSSDHHCNEAYDWWPIADLWSIKCVLSAPGRPSSELLTSDTAEPAALITHPLCSPRVTAAANGHTRAVKILSAPTTWDVVKTKLVTCLKTKFEWWNFRTFVFIEKVLANDHIISITFGSITSSHLNYGENFNHTLCFKKCHRICF